MFLTNNSSNLINSRLINLVQILRRYLCLDYLEISRGVFLAKALALKNNKKTIGDRPLESCVNITSKQSFFNSDLRWTCLSDSMECPSWNSVDLKDGVL